ncbi:MAG TPA: tetratricopeptide repeat protein [Anaerolineae bacterium]|nr:tetratricopeptide repeat protein [Anaerolineae bacterium]
MSKKKRDTQPKPDRQMVRPPSGQLLSRLSEVESLTQRRRWGEAAELLESLDRRYPHRAEVLTELVNVYYELGDRLGYQRACENLHRVTPRDPDLTLALAGAYLSNLHPALALHTFRRFLERWPDHARAAEVRKTLSELEPALDGVLDEVGVEGDEGFALALQHETVQAYLEQGRYREARQAAEELLRRHPKFAPALNNISQTYFAEGKLDRAIATTQQVLAFDPDNVHALSNLARYLVLSGRVGETPPLLERLKASSAKAAEVWLKKAEALSVVGDDHGVLELFRQAEQSGDLNEMPTSAMVYHLAAVAALRAGGESDARRYWQQALKLNPGLDLARQNLDDLRKRVGERHAPWALPLANWVTRQAIEDFAAQIEPAARRDDAEAVSQGARRFLRRHPEVVGVMPILLDRGDPDGREFAVRLALMARTPELLAALRDFALGQHGPDQLRFEAAQAANQAGLLSPGLTRLWMDGAWREIMLMGFELHDDPLISHPPQVEALLIEAIQAIRDDDPQTAERLLKQALEIEPDMPDLTNNLAMAYEMQGRSPEAQALVRQTCERHPDYVFACLGLARLHVTQGRLDEAKALLAPLLARRRWHFSEFTSFCSAQIDLLLAEGNRDAAQSWLEMWGDVNPEDPALERYRRLVGPPGRLRRWLGRRGRSD